jgi:hypothetical protein
MTLKTPLRLAALLLAASTIGATESPRASTPAQSPAKPDPAVMDVYKTPTCGCCSKWVDHMRAAKFQARVVDMPQEELDKVKAKHGLPPTLASCHTAIVGGYVIEGHIPADQVRKLLKERPKVAGIAVPGMPIGSPGMEVPGRRGMTYNVFTFDKQGKTQIFSTVNP